MAAGMVKAGSHDPVSDPIITQIKDVTDVNQYFYRYDPQRLSESFQSGQDEILSFFPCPSETLSSI